MFSDLLTGPAPWRHIPLPGGQSHPIRSVSHLRYESRYTSTLQTELVKSSTSSIFSHPERPTEAAQEAFLRALEKRKVTATLRREKGHDIDAACGQLRLRTERDALAVKN